MTKPGRSASKPHTKKKLFRKKKLEPANDLIKMDYEVITLTNLYRKYEDDKIEPPSELKQYRDQNYDCHILKFSVNLRKSKASKGAKELYVDAEILGGPEGGVHIDDVVPKTSWVDKDYAADVDVGVDFAKAGQLATAQLVPITSPVTGKLGIKLKWKPKVGEVIHEKSGRTMGWTLRRTGNRPFLNGENEFMAVVRRRRTNDALTLHIKEVKAVYAKHDQNPATLKDIKIPLEIIESSEERPKESDKG